MILILKLIFINFSGRKVIWHAFEPFIQMKSLNYMEKLYLDSYISKNNCVISFSPLKKWQGINPSP